MSYPYDKLQQEETGEAPQVPPPYSDNPGPQPVASGQSYPQSCQPAGVPPQPQYSAQAQAYAYPAAQGPAQYPQGQCPQGQYSGQVPQQPYAPQAQPVAPVQYMQPPRAQTVVVSQVTGSTFYSYGSYIHIPILHVGVAIVILILNLLTSGFGTTLGGFLVLCCGHTVHPSRICRSDVACHNIGIGFLQHLLSMFFMIGYIWSIVSGVYYILGSVKYYGNPADDSVQTSTVVVAN